VFLTNAVNKTAVAEAWYAIVGSGDVRHLWAGTRTEALRNPRSVGGYAAKYAAKRLQKEVPDGFTDVGRFWGVWGKPAITTETLVRGADAVSLVRTVRRAYLAKRKTWKCRRRFRDNGRAGFTGWDSGPVAAQSIRILTASRDGQILKLRQDTSGKWAGADRFGARRQRLFESENRPHLEIAPCNRTRRLTVIDERRSPG
jgi:hypothetical protein